MSATNDWADKAAEDQFLGDDVAQHQREANQIRVQRCAPGFWECSGCGCQVIDEPGNFCSFCATGGAI